MLGRHSPSSDPLCLLVPSFQSLALAAGALRLLILTIYAFYTVVYASTHGLKIAPGLASEH
jgi:hypothetical protein